MEIARKDPRNFYSRNFLASNLGVYCQRVEIRFNAKVKAKGHNLFLL